MSSTRLRLLRRPLRVRAAFSSRPPKPRPLSSISRVKASGSRRRRIWTSVAWAWRTTLVTASLVVDVAGDALALLFESLLPAEAPYAIEPAAIGPHPDGVFLGPESTGIGVEVEIDLGGRGCAGWTGAP